jgi:hypothetical protein
MEIGQVHPLTITTRKESHPISLGGRSWTVLDVDWDRKRVAVTPSKGKGKVLWLGDAAPLGIEQCREYRDVLIGNEVEEEWTPRAASEIAAAREKLHFLKRDHTTLQVTPTQKQTWWTFAGLLANTQIASWLEAKFQSKMSPNNYSIEFGEPVDTSELAKWIHDMQAGSRPGFQPSPELAERLKFNECLPSSLMASEMKARYDDAPGVNACLSVPVAIFHTQ